MSFLYNSFNNQEFIVPARATPPTPCEVVAVTFGKNWAGKNNGEVLFSPVF
jgi:hypothetical protein